MKSSHNSDKAVTRKILLRLGIALLLTTTIVGLTLIAASRYFAPYFASLATALIRSATGLDVSFRKITLRLGIHPAFIIGDGELLNQGQKVLRFRQLTVLYSYSAVLSGKGLPLEAVIVDQPRLSVDIGATTPSSNELLSTNPFGPGLAEIQRRLAAQGRKVFALLGKFANEASIQDGIIVAPSGQPLVTNLSLSLDHSRRSDAVWVTRFAMALAAQPVEGLRLVGDGMLDFTENARGSWAQLQLNFWRGSSRFSLKDLTLISELRGSVKLVLSESGDSQCDSTLKLVRASIAAPLLNGPTQSANYVLTFSSKINEDSARLNQLLLSYNGEELLQGAIEVTNLRTKTPRVTARLRGPTIDLSQVKDWLSRLKRHLTPVDALVKSLQSASLSIDQLDFKADLTPNEKFADLLRKGLRVVATVQKVSFTLPPEYRLPDVVGLRGQILFEQGKLIARDVEAHFGRSTLDDGLIEADLAFGAKWIPFIVRARALVDLEEATSLAPALVRKRSELFNQYMQKVSGTALAKAQLKGLLKNGRQLTAENYVVELYPRKVELDLLRPKRHLQLVEGTLSLVPGLLTLKRLKVADGDGYIVLNASADLAGQSPDLRRIDAHARHFRADDWLGLFVKPENAEVKGFLTGRVSIVGSPGLGKNYSAYGSITLSPCHVKLKILRSPVESESATLNLYGSSGQALFERVEYEGNPAGLKISLPDITKPLVNLDIFVSRLDLRSLKFIRFPGQPKPPPPHFSPDTLISGHAVIDVLAFDQFTFDNVELDFERHGQKWKVYNLKGLAYGGNFQLEVRGRSEDDILNIILRLSRIDVAWLLASLGEGSKPVLSGSLDASAELVGDTNDNFRETVSGKASFYDRNGTVYRLVLLSRLLSTMSVSGVLRGRLPDPFVEGIPFRVLKGSFTIKDGTMHTENVVLDGPVMRMSAFGNVYLPSNTLDLTVGVMPFNMLDKLLNMIPVLGTGVAKHDSLLAFYFNVRGRAADPSVAPAPLTSVTNVLKKILTLPVNIINSELQHSPRDQN